MFLASCKLKLKKIKWRSCAAALWIQVKCGAGVTFQSSGSRVSKSFRSFFEWRRMFAAASYVVSDHLEVQRNFCAERVRQVVGGKPITHRAMIGPIERRRADELLSLRGCTHRPARVSRQRSAGRSQRLSAVCWPVGWWGRTRLGPELKAAWSCSA